MLGENNNLGPELLVFLSLLLNTLSLVFLVRYQHGHVNGFLVLSAKQWASLAGK